MEKETSRVEAFSEKFYHSLVNLWPSYIAFGLSFMTVLDYEKNYEKKK